MRPREKHEILGDRLHPFGLGRWIERYLEHLEIKNYAKRSQRDARIRLNRFARWADERSLQTVSEITRPILERYQRYLFYYRNDKGKALSFRCQGTYLVALRGFFRWLAKDHIILNNPAAELELPKLPTRLPREVLSVSEVESVLAECDIERPRGLRDRALIETLYSTGIRNQELCRLRLEDLHDERGVLFIREGKGGKDRVVPIGARARAWVLKYCEQARKHFTKDHKERALFVSGWGKPFTDSAMSRLVKGYLRKVGLEKRGACHIFRHTMATHMLEGGADLRTLQLILGHASLSTTEIYTQVSIRHIKKVHERTHPAKLERKEDTESTENIEV